MAEATDEKNKKYDPDDVTTWSTLEFDSKVSSKIKIYWSKIESIKNLLLEGKQVMAYQQMQGLSDGFQFLSGIYDTRIEGHNQKNGNSSN